jgi:hypothetical protein
MLKNKLSYFVNRCIGLMLSPLKGKFWANVGLGKSSKIGHHFKKQSVLNLKMSKNVHNKKS